MSAEMTFRDGEFRLHCDGVDHHMTREAVIALRESINEAGRDYVNDQIRKMNEAAAAEAKATQ